MVILGTGLVAGVSHLPLVEPAHNTETVYAALEKNRAIRQDVRAEPTVQSVQSMAAPSESDIVERAPSPPVRLQIPRISVDAPVIEMGILPDGTMDAPNAPDLVAWYGFSGTPGQPGNAVFSAHVDFVRHGPAVFWDLRKLTPGDVIDVQLEDGSSERYTVTASQQYPVASVPMAEVLAQTNVPTATLMTCAGVFQNGAYSDLLVVRAVANTTSPSGTTSR